MHRGNFNFDAHNWDFGNAKRYKHLNRDGVAYFNGNNKLKR